MKGFKELVVILKGMLASIRTVGWVSLLIMMITYIFAIILTQTIGQEGVDTYPASSDTEITFGLEDFNNYQYFGSIPRSMYTLFNIVILAEWAEIGRAVIEKQAYLFPIFFLFVIFTTFGLVNVVVGCIVESMMTAAAKVNRHAQGVQTMLNLKKLKGLHDVIYNLDIVKENDFQITKDVFSKMWSDIPDVYEDLVQVLDLPRFITAGEVFDLLNSSTDSVLTAKEFMLNTFRLNDHDNFHMNVLSLISSHRSARHAETMMNHLENVLESMHRTEKQHTSLLCEIRDMVRGCQSSRGHRSPRSPSKCTPGHRSPQKSTLSKSSRSAGNVAPTCSASSFSSVNRLGLQEAKSQFCEKVSEGKVSRTHSPHLADIEEDSGMYAAAVSMSKAPRHINPSVTKPTELPREDTLDNRVCETLDTSTVWLEDLGAGIVSNAGMQHAVEEHLEHVMIDVMGQHLDQLEHAMRGLFANKIQHIVAKHFECVENRSNGIKPDAHVLKSPVAGSSTTIGPVGAVPLIKESRNPRPLDLSILIEGTLDTGSEFVPHSPPPSNHACRSSISACSEPVVGL